MRIFKPLYEFALRWAAKPRAEWYLAGLSFVEAFIFPIMPEFMLAPMTLAKPERWLRYSVLSLGFSLLGAFVGYALGHYAFESLRPLLADMGWLPTLDEWIGKLRNGMHENLWKAFGFLMLAALTPILPLKIFTWAAGIVGVPMLPFVAGVLIGRGKRVLLLCGAIRLGGERAEKAVHRWIEWMGWGILVLLALAVLYFKYLR
jgi:membrane protein YqaA with SNARE-associated domain